MELRMCPRLLLHNGPPSGPTRPAATREWRRNTQRRGEQEGVIRRQEGGRVRGIPVPARHPKPVLHNSWLILIALSRLSFYIIAASSSKFLAKYVRSGYSAPYNYNFFRPFFVAWLRNCVTCESRGDVWRWPEHERCSPAASSPQRWRNAILTIGHCYRLNFTELVMLILHGITLQYLSRGP